MADFKVVVSDYVFPDLEIEREMLTAAGVDFVPGQCRSAQQIIALAEDADAMFNTYFEPLDESIFAACPKLKVVVRYGVGVNTIHVEDATRCGVMVANVPNYCQDEVSDHAVALWLALARKIVQADRTIRTGDWGMQPLEPITNLRGQTAGIIGLGRLGSKAARKLNAFGVELLFTDPYVETGIDLEGIDCRKVELEQLCRQSDAIFVHAPANEETHHLLNAERFAQMERRPFIINTARAPLIDTAALVTELEQDQVRGAGLDLVDNERLDAGHPLLHFDNVIITPHIAWYSEQSKIALRRLATQEILRVLQGGKPNSLLNPEVVPR